MTSIDAIASTDLLPASALRVSKSSCCRQWSDALSAGHLCSQLSLFTSYALVALPFVHWVLFCQAGISGVVGANHGRVTITIIRTGKVVAAFNLALVLPLGKCLPIQDSM